MIKSARTDPQEQIAEIWFDIFLTETGRLREIVTEYSAMVTGWNPKIERQQESPDPTCSSKSQK